NLRNMQIDWRRGDLRRDQWEWRKVLTAAPDAPPPKASIINHFAGMTLASPSIRVGDSKLMSEKTNFFNEEAPPEVVGELADRLFVAAGRIEAHIYARPVTAAEIRFFLDWADALKHLTRHKTVITRAPSPLGALKTPFPRIYGGLSQKVIWTIAGEYGNNISSTRRRAPRRPDHRP
ncbi:hypothetical protein JZU48_04635, partial [bacterium]|nr:hypothetical protein [bacterium]